MAKRVLDVGNCDLDHGNLRELIEDHFDAELVRCHGFADALEELLKQPFDLVLVNRLMDRDQSPGLEIIRRIKADPAFSATPCILMTNFAEHQQAAVAAGAEPGFGKRELHLTSTRALLSRYLGFWSGSLGECKILIGSKSCRGSKLRIWPFPGTCLSTCI